MEADIDTESSDLGFSLDIDGDGCFSSLTEQSVGMGNHAQVIEVLSAAGLNVSETIYRGGIFQEPLSETELFEIYENCRTNWINYLESHRASDSVMLPNDMPYVVKAWKKDGIVYFVECYQNKARTIDYLDATGISEEIIWWVELILMIIGGGCSAIFGLSLGTGNRIVNKLVNIIMSNTKVLTALKSMLLADITMEVILNIFSLFYKNNILKKIFKIVLVSISYWSVLTIIAKVATWAMGYGWAAAAVQLAAMVVEISLHIMSYPNKENDKPDISPITLAEITYTNVSIENSDSNFMESLTLKKNGGMQSVAQGWSRDKNMCFSCAAYDIERAETHAITMNVKFIPSENCPDTIWVRARDENVLKTSETIRINSSTGKEDEKRGVIVFKNHSIYDRGISRIKTSISWEYSIDNGIKWKKITVSNLTIYVLLSKPEHQWNNRGLWTDALDYIIGAVEGCKDEGSLYAKVTENINGTNGLSYEMSNGTPYYSNFNSVKLTDFIKDRQNKINSKVNCSDCATIVSTFANLFGGQLRCEWMTYSETNKIKDSIGFYINPIIAIGKSVYGFPEWGAGFSFHEVAMLHDRLKDTENDNEIGILYRTEDPDNTKHKIYDACLKINYGSNPESVANDIDLAKAKLPIKMSFSQYTDDQVINDQSNVHVMENDDSYREHLSPIAIGGVDHCLVYYCNDTQSYKSIK